MNRLAAKLLARAGIAMLVLCIACRFIITTEAAMMGDNLAIISSAALTVVALVYLRIAPHDEADKRRERTRQGPGAGRK